MTPADQLEGVSRQWIAANVSPVMKTDRFHISARDHTRRIVERSPIYLAGLMLLTTSCTGIVFPSSSPTSVAAPTAVETTGGLTPTAVSGLLTTPTNVPGSSDAEVAPTVNPPEPQGLPIQAISKNCLPVQDIIAPGLLSPGTIFLADFSKLGSVGPVLSMSAAALQPSTLADVPDYWGIEDTSPNAQRLLYAHDRTTSSAEYIGTQIVVLSGDGVVDAKLEADPRSAIIRWLNNDTIVELLDTGSFGSALILNPLTRERRQIQPSLPDAWAPGGSNYRDWGVAYDPALKLVAYQRGQNAPETLAVRDLENERDIWTLKRASTGSIRPEWSPDGRILAVAAMDRPERLEVFLVDRSGTATNWVSLTDYTGELPGELRWSPDGRYLAIAPLHGPFLVLDTSEVQLHTYCIASDLVSARHILWSPDSAQVVVPTSAARSPVVAVGRPEAFYLVDDRELGPLGWLVTPH